LTGIELYFGIPAQEFKKNNSKINLIEILFISFLLQKLI